MQMLMAIIQPFRIDDVIKSLVDIGVNGVTVQEVKGFGTQHGHGEVYRGAEYACDLLPKVQLTVLVGDDMLDQVKDAIVTDCRTGRIGDGILWSVLFDSYMRIRTGENVTA